MTSLTYQGIACTVPSNRARLWPAVRLSDSPDSESIGQIGVVYNHFFHFFIADGGDAVHCPFPCDIGDLFDDLIDVGIEMILRQRLFYEFS